MRKITRRRTPRGRRHGSRRRFCSGSYAAPNAPAVLNHLVLGINETIKALERNIDDLKARLILIADRLNGISLPTRNDLLPTAPRSPSPEPSPARAKEPTAPLGWVIVPLLSVNPPSLVSPMPQYCATYNSLVHQWGQLRKTVKTRLKESEWDVLGPEREEIRVVPLGEVEKDMAAFVGLRRLACMGVRVSSRMQCSAAAGADDRHHTRINRF